MGVVLCILDGFTDPEFDPADYPALSGLRRLGDVDTALGEKPESLNCILHLLGIRNVPPLLRPKPSSTRKAQASGTGFSPERTRN